MSIQMSAYMSIHLPIHMSIRMSIHMSAHLSTQVSIHMSTVLAFTKWAQEVRPMEFRFSCGLGRAAGLVRQTNSTLFF